MAPRRPGRVAIGVVAATLLACACTHAQAPGSPNSLPAEARVELSGQDGSTWELRAEPSHDGSAPSQSPTGHPGQPQARNAGKGDSVPAAAAASSLPSSQAPSTRSTPSVGAAAARPQLRQDGKERLGGAPLHRAGAVPGVPRGRGAGDADAGSDQVVQPRPRQGGRPRRRGRSSTKQPSTQGNMIQEAPAVARAWIEDGFWKPIAEDDLVVKLPVTVANTAAVALILFLAVLGSVYIYKLCTQPKCSCPLCMGDYAIERTLGSGGFGSVYRVRRTVDGHLFVLKKVPVTDLNDANDAHTEARELRFLQHPRIVAYEDDFMHLTPSSAGRDGHIYVCIIMELCERDMRIALEEFRRAGKRFTEDHLLRYLTQLCSALAYCHSKQIIHRDIKPQNVFLDADDNIRLGDFGLCRQFRTAYTSFTDAGTDCYKAPETLLGGRRDGRKSDMWSVGLLMHELVTHTLAWERKQSVGARMLHYKTGLEDMMKLVPPSYSTSFRKLVRRLLHPDPKTRPSAQDVLGMRLLRRHVRADARLRAKALQNARRAAEQRPSTPEGRAAGSGAGTGAGTGAGSGARACAMTPGPVWTGTPQTGTPRFVTSVGTDTTSLRFHPSPATSSGSGSGHVGDAGAAASSHASDSSSAAFFALVSDASSDGSNSSPEGGDAQRDVRHRQGAGGGATPRSTRRGRQVGQAGISAHRRAEGDARGAGGDGDRDGTVRGGASGAGRVDGAAGGGGGRVRRHRRRRSSGDVATPHRSGGAEETAAAGGGAGDGASRTPATAGAGDQAGWRRRRRRRNRHRKGGVNRTLPFGAEVVAARHGVHPTL